MRWRRKDEPSAPPRTPGILTAASPPQRPAAPASVPPSPTSPSPGGGDAWDRPVTPATPSGAERAPVQQGTVAAADLERSLRRIVAQALAEDLGDAGDVTTAATVPANLDGTAELVARAPGVVAGADAVREVFAQVDPRVTVTLAVSDGDRVERGDVLGTVTGRLRSILTGERVALNLLCHLSGVATQTRRYADALAGSATVVRDTRKTTPGLRLLEKAAVKAGGGANHRIGLYDALLVKDNHVLAAGSAAVAARAALARAGGRHVQVEVSSIDQLDEVLREGVTDVLLDNFSPDDVRIAVRRVAGRARLEASGNITLDNIRDYADAGVDTVATGALTHSAPWLDIALDVRADSVGAGAPVDDPAEDAPLVDDAVDDEALAADLDPPTWEDVAPRPSGED
jgi:nicotinate-nucleotide pyrophosphorylase (carboxylating)